MNRLKKLRDQLAIRIKDMKALSDKAEAEGRQLSEQEQKDWDAHEAECAAIRADIARLERLAELEKQLAPVPDANVEAAKEAVKAATREEKLTVPAYAKSARTKHFKGDDAGALAYQAGMWFLAINGNAKAKRFCRDHGIGIQFLAEGETDNTKGGFLVPDVLANTIIDLRETYGVFRQQCRVWPMSSETLTVPRRTAGLTAYFVAENTQVTDSTKGWDAVNLTARKLASLSLYASELAEDAVINIADDLAFEIGYAFALKEDQCGFIGDGTSTYGGIYGIATKINDGNYAGSIAGADTGDVSFETLDIDDFTRAVGLLPVYAQPNAKWYISQAGFANSMQRLMYSAGGNTVDTISGKPQLSFLGYPVVITQVLNSTLGSDVSKIKALFGDLRLSSSMGDRREITIRTSAERYFEYDQLAIIGTERFDIVNHDIGDGTNAGPIVAVKTAAS